MDTYYLKTSFQSNGAGSFILESNEVLLLHYIISCRVQILNKSEQLASHSLLILFSDFHLGILEFKKRRRRKKQKRDNFEQLVCR